MLGTTITGSWPARAGLTVCGAHDPEHDRVEVKTISWAGAYFHRAWSSSPNWTAVPYYAAAIMRRRSAPPNRQRPVPSRRSVAGSGVTPPLADNSSSGPVPKNMFTSFTDVAEVTPVTSRTIVTVPL